MSMPIASFSYSPLSGKIPFEVNFHNQSINLGGTDPWNSCPLGKKYLYSPLQSSDDQYALDFSGVSGIKTYFNENGFVVSFGVTTLDGIAEWETGDYIIHKDGVWNRLPRGHSLDGELLLAQNARYYKGLWDATGNRPTLDNDGVGGEDGDYFQVKITGQPRYPGNEYIRWKEPISVNCDDDFYIEFTIDQFKNWFGSVQLYFDSIEVPPYTSNPGIHINTEGNTPDERGWIRGINNFGNQKSISDIEFPAKFKFTKVGNVLTAYINDEAYHTIAASVLGINSGLHNLHLKVGVRNDVDDWIIGIKDVYVINSNMPSNCLGQAATYLWDFDDGETSTEEHPTHIFEEGGPKHVTLITTTEEGSAAFATGLYVIPESEINEDAENIYRTKLADIVKNFDDIPNYCDNQMLREVINAALHDAIRHADVIQDSVTARIKITLNEIYAGLRAMRIETFFVSGLYDDIHKPLVRRTIVEPGRQGDVADVTFDFENP